MALAGVVRFVPLDSVAGKAARDRAAVGGSISGDVAAQARELNRQARGNWS
jgi:hypothetical protein